MALSQKYDGLALMPWFDVAEWTSVKNLIYSGDIESQKLALDRMEIWKLRTPLVSVGIDGTIVLLGALLAEKDNLQDKQLVQIYSISLLRFLNICAASNDKQGTFYKTAEKNDLPSWLITLRHEIAHGNMIPSKKFLRMSLNHCLQWVKEKYWNVTQMEDYVVSEETNFKDLVHHYAKLKLLNYFKESTDSLIEEIKKKIGSSLSDGFNHGLTASDFLILLEDHLIQSVTQDKIKDSSIYIVSTLVEKEVILTINYCSVNGVKKIPSNFLQIWQKLLNLLYQNSTLFLLINKLVDVTESNAFEYSAKEIASLWIAELYQGLLKTKKMKEEYDTVTSMHSEQIDKKTAKLIFKSKLDTSPQFKDTITFSEFELLPMDDSRMFQERILQTPNEYTMNYLEMVLRLNGNTESVIKKKINLIKKLVQFSTTFYTDPVTIYSVHDLQTLQETYSSSTPAVENKMPSETERIEDRRKFRELTEAEKFRYKCYPLGHVPPS
ncbi:protein LAS1 [Harmonia axyridis]|uniref:protein LAS1 n=1 Tax=Harmonia axyridis TaxID=115357 RepID=UPI001E2756C0|nr:protein LAS1 [Harmonia axyridis]